MIFHQQLNRALHSLGRKEPRPMGVRAPCKHSPRNLLAQTLGDQLPCESYSVRLGDVFDADSPWLGDVFDADRPSTALWLPLKAGPF